MSCWIGSVPSGQGTKVLQDPRIWGTAPSHTIPRRSFQRVSDLAFHLPERSQSEPRADLRQQMDWHTIEAVAIANGAFCGNRRASGTGPLGGLNFMQCGVHIVLLEDRLRLGLKARPDKGFTAKLIKGVNF